MVFSLFSNENFQFSFEKREKTNIIGRLISPVGLMRRPHDYFPTFVGIENNLSL
jgi:hypothetical protein